jgi:hypothetical protein
VSIGFRIAVLLLTLGFLYALARLFLRITGSDRATGLLGLYAASLYLPFVAVVTGSASHPVALLLLTAGVLEILDVNIASANAVRSGLYLSVASIVDPSCLVLAAALLPVVALVAWPRWWFSVPFVLAVGVPWALAHALPRVAGVQGSVLPLHEAAVLPENLGAMASALARYARGIRVSWDTDFLWTYGAFAFAGLLVLTVRRMGPSRRGIAAVLWLLLVVTMARAALDERAAPLFGSLGYLLLIMLANTGLAALAAMNPLHEGRRRMIPVSAFFLLPPIIGWVRLVV